MDQYYLNNMEECRIKYGSYKEYLRQKRNKYKKEWDKKNISKIKSYQNSDVFKERNRKRSEKHVKTLSNVYVYQILKYRGFSKEQVDSSPGLLEITRSLLFVKRKIRGLPVKERRNALKGYSVKKLATSYIAELGVTKGLTREDVYNNLELQEAIKTIVKIKREIYGTENSAN